MGLHGWLALEPFSCFCLFQVGIQVVFGSGLRKLGNEAGRANVRTKGRGGVFRCRRKPYAAASSRPTSQPQVAILRLHDTKRSLADALLEGADMSSRLSKEELLKLFSDQG